MKLRTIALVTLGLAVGACATDDNMAGGGGGGGGGGDGTTTGKKITSIQVVDAVIAPGMGKGSREPWDGVDMVPDAVWQGLAAALGAPAPYAAVIQFFGTAALSELDKPDPFGTAALFSDYSPDDGIEKPLSTEANNDENTYMPSWRTPARWDNVPLSSDVRVRLTLTDEDLTDNDSIGVVELNATDLANALAAGQIAHIQVDDQANGTVLFVGVSVRQTGVEP